MHTGRIYIAIGEWFSTAELQNRTPKGMYIALDKSGGQTRQVIIKAKTIG